MPTVPVTPCLLLDGLDVRFLGFTRHRGPTRGRGMMAASTNRPRIQKGIILSLPTLEGTSQCSSLRWSTAICFQR